MTCGDHLPMEGLPTTRHVSKGASCLLSSPQKLTVRGALTPTHPAALIAQEGVSAPSHMLLPCSPPLPPGPGPGHSRRPHVRRAFFFPSKNGCCSGRPVCTQCQEGRARGGGDTPPQRAPPGLGRVRCRRSPPPTSPCGAKSAAGRGGASGRGDTAPPRPDLGAGPARSCWAPRCRPAPAPSPIPVPTLGPGRAGRAGARRWPGRAGWRRGEAAPAGLW